MIDDVISEKIATEKCQFNRSLIGTKSRIPINQISIY